MFLTRRTETINLISLALFLFLFDPLGRALLSTLLSPLGPLHDILTSHITKALLTYIDSSPDILPVRIPNKILAYLWAWIVNMVGRPVFTRPAYEWHPSHDDWGIMIPPIRFHYDASGYGSFCGQHPFGPLATCFIKEGVVVGTVLSSHGLALLRRG